MTVFISYSHADKKKVDLLAAKLVAKNASIWIDSWELNAGDSIIDRIQEAITSSDALLVILSKSSVNSPWCKKELNSGLIRELDEKRVVVIPVLLEECEIPLFLKEKLYADIRSDIDSGVDSIINSVAKVSNPNQSRISDENSFLDWAVDWEVKNDLFQVRFTFVNSINILRMSFLTEVIVTCNDMVTRRQREFHEAGIGWMGRILISEALFDFGSHQEFRVLLEDTKPKKISARLEDKKLNAQYDIYVTCRKLGEDNGKDQLVNISDLLKIIRDYVQSTSKKPTTAEKMKFSKIISTPMK